MASSNTSLVVRVGGQPKLVKEVSLPNPSTGQVQVKGVACGTEPNGWYNVLPLSISIHVTYTPPSNLLM
ncbi:hypothetical protein N7457_009641 [Penicillium paradoxum]|uniref:uncharacterized protein n=1 Tax=Penicillium paradoxum TaxID=176176 RepID=UPI002546CBF1|nr:uncharacterized protein N7457_009641 [Penicillium paradoxum]KAJ5774745.1 hypothetical protein N7457_009641 [Penicillium paradoxum]